MKTLGASIAFVLFSALLFSQTSAFDQTVAEYRKAPSSEGAIAIIKMASAMEQLPPVPEQARKHFVMGTVMFKKAKTPETYFQSASEFTQCIQIAPWLPEAHYDLALVNEASGDYDAAIGELKVYQLFKLSEDDARKVQDKVYAIEAEMQIKLTDDKNALAAAAAEAVAKQKAAQDARETADRMAKEWLGRLDGAKFSYKNVVADDFTNSVLISITRGMAILGQTPYFSGSMLRMNGSKHGRYLELGRAAIDANTRTFLIHQTDAQDVWFECAISADGQRLEITRRSEGSYGSFVGRRPIFDKER
jgi:hypothetical protein